MIPSHVFFLIGVVFAGGQAAGSIIVKPESGTAYLGVMAVGWFLMAAAAEIREAIDKQTAVLAGQEDEAEEGR